MPSRQRNGLVCPLCASESDVLERRPLESGQALRRRHACCACGFRWTTYEHNPPSQPSTVACRLTTTE